MSVRSDIEFLSIQTMEWYAKKNNMNTEDVMQLFHRHQIFEKIVLQHEYLHQISFEEVMEFVEKALLDESKELLLYHGTAADFEQISLRKSHNRRDFGIGFYTTILEKQAKEWAYRLSLREKKKRFNALDKEWLEFIKENRSKGGLQHSYDVVIGPVADDNTMETVQLYLTGILTVNEAVERLKYNKVNNQVSFHTEKALRSLQFVRREKYE